MDVRKGFVATDTCLSRQNYGCLDKTCVCLEKSLPRRAYFSRAKRRVLSPQTQVCRDKSMLVAIKLCLLWQISISRRTFCLDKHTFVATKDKYMFGATKPLARQN